MLLSATGLSPGWRGVGNSPPPSAPSMLPLVERIEIKGLRVFGRHGALERERREGQPFVVDVSLELDLSRAATTDALADTVDYSALARKLALAVGRTRFDLIEALAGHLADLALSDPKVWAAEVRVAKPHAPVTVQLDEVAVVVRRARQGQSP